jgi:hypothetical protein
MSRNATMSISGTSLRNMRDNVSTRSDKDRRDILACPEWPGGPLYSGDDPAATVRGVVGDDSMGRGLVDEGLARRLKALACTAPLHDLDGRKTRLDWADASKYQMAEIALQIIDQVTIAMDFDRGAGHEQVVGRLRPFVAVQAPDRGEDEHDRITRWVLDNLINVGSVDRGFHAV